MTTTMDRPSRDRRPGARDRVAAGAATEPEAKVAKPAEAGRAPRPRRRTGRPGRPRARAAVLSSAFTMIAIVCLWMAAQMLFLGVDLPAPRPGPALRRVPPRSSAGRRTESPLGPIVPVGDPVALLTIPSIGLEQVVVEGTASGDTLVGPGHRRDTPLPGPGRHLGRLRPRDDVRRAVRRPDRAAGRRQDPGRRRPGQARSSRSSASGARATRCRSRPPTAPPGSRSSRRRAAGASARSRPDSVVYVDADAKKGVPRTAGRPAAVPDSEKAMAARRGRTAAARPLPGPAPGADPRGRRRPSAMVDGARVGGGDPPRDRTVLGVHGCGDATPAQPDLTSPRPPRGGMPDEEHRRIAAVAPNPAATTSQEANHDVCTQDSRGAVAAAVAGSAIALTAGSAAAARLHAGHRRQHDHADHRRRTSSGVGSDTSSTRSSCSRTPGTSGARADYGQSFDVATFGSSRRRRPAGAADRGRTGKALIRPNGSGAGTRHPLRRRHRVERRLRPLLGLLRRRRASPPACSVIPFALDTVVDGGLATAARRTPPNPTLTLDAAAWTSTSDLHASPTGTQVGRHRRPGHRAPQIPQAGSGTRSLLQGASSCRPHDQLRRLRQGPHDDANVGRYAVQEHDDSLFKNNPNAVVPFSKGRAGSGAAPSGHRGRGLVQARPLQRGARRTTSTDARHPGVLR